MRSILTQAYAVNGSSFQRHVATKHLKNLTENLSISFYLTFINCNVIFFLRQFLFMVLAILELTL